MVALIQNSIHFNGKRNLLNRSIKPNRYGIIGNGEKSVSTILPFTAGTFENDDQRYLFAKNDSGLYELTGPFAADTIATRIINGNIFGQFESFAAVNNSYSHVLSSQFNTLSHSLWSDNDANDPLGNLTADKLIEDTANDEHKASYSESVVDGESYAISLFFKPNTRSIIRITVEGVIVKSIYAYINLSTQTIESSLNFDDIFIALALDSWVYILGTITTDATGAADIGLCLCNENGDPSYLGVSGYGLHCWGYNFREGKFDSSYIDVNGSSDDREADLFSYPSADIPEWMNEKFKVKLNLNYDYPDDIEVYKPLWSYETDPLVIFSGSGNYGLKTDDTYLYWANSNGQIKRCKLDGTELIDLISSGLTTPVDVCVDDTYIYICDYSGKILRANLNGYFMSDFVTGLTNPAGVCSDSSYIYWCDSGSQKIQRANISDGSGVTDLATGETVPRSLRENGDYVYWSSSSTGNIRRILKAGGSAENILTGCGQPFGIFVCDNYIYYSSLSTNTIGIANKKDLVKHTFCEVDQPYTIAVKKGSFYCSISASAIVRKVDLVTAELSLDGKIRVYEGSIAKVETDTASASKHQDLEITFDRLNHSIKLDGFTSGDGLYNTGESWSARSGYNLDYGCGFGGAASLDGIMSAPIKERSV